MPQLIRIRDHEQTDRPRPAVKLEGQDRKELVVSFQQQAGQPIDVDKQLIFGL
ncbi:hypothetical protein P4H66_27630 [Paenibacillus dokdonensis]|uniref:Uncharacterized protein n=1 Tax=Paenibacillus dokdonensis TaxID=2567944 RepID=A0ABU6GY00_9BACL|nr:hypothetical protein [Paenibacillus dokdonensis]MEC0243595.1 hypothetical protein [Paenibacillus dokdonensis]